MLNYLFDFLFVLITAGVAFYVSRGSILQSALLWLSVLLAALIALNTFEPIASVGIERLFLPSDDGLTCYLWCATLLAIFSFTALLLLAGCNNLLPTVQNRSGSLQTIGRWSFSILAAYTLSAFLLTAIQTLPTNRDFWGAFQPERQNRAGLVMLMGPDYQLLSVAEYTLTPRGPLSGMPWQPGGPLFSTDITGNRWASFPARYALWREAMNIQLNDYDLPGEESEGLYAEDLQVASASKIAGK